MLNLLFGWERPVCLHFRILLVGPCRGNGEGWLDQQKCPLRKQRSLLQRLQDLSAATAPSGPLV